MELRQLRYFVTVAEELHFTRAAQRLFIATPSLSQQVKALERALGVLLFVRTTTSVALTPAGAVLAEDARRVLAAADALGARAAGLAEHRLRLAHLGDADTLPHVLDRLELDAPGLEVVDRVTASPGEQVRALLAGDLDAALCPVDVVPGGMRADLVRLAPARLLAAGPGAGDLSALGAGVSAGDDPDWAVWSRWVAALEHRLGTPLRRVARPGGPVRHVRRAVERATASSPVLVVEGFHTDFRVPGVTAHPVRELTPLVSWSLLTRRGDRRESVRLLRRAAQRAATEHGWLALAVRAPWLPPDDPHVRRLSGPGVGADGPGAGEGPGRRRRSDG